MVETDLTASLSRLESVARELNAESDSINHILRAVEKRLTAFNVGLEVWLERPLLGKQDRARDHGVDGPIDTWYELRLGHAKTEEGWGLAVKRLRLEYGFYQGDPNSPYTTTYEDSKPTPIQKVSRDVRVAVLRHLSDLLSEITDHADTAVKTIQKAKQMVRELAEVEYQPTVLMQGVEKAAKSAPRSRKRK